MRRVSVGKSRLYSRCRRSVFDRYQPIGENCASFGKREFTSSTISMLATAPNNPQAAVPATAAIPTITRGFMVEIVTGCSGQDGRECLLAIAVATLRLCGGPTVSYVSDNSTGRCCLLSYFWVAGHSSGSESGASDFASWPPKKPYRGNLQRNYRHEYCPIAGAGRNPNHLKRKLTSFFYFVRDDHHIHRRPMSPQLPCDTHFTKDNDGQETLCRKSS